jgi:hypothetical protein
MQFHCREIIASAAAMAGFSPPRHEVDFDKHQYVPAAPPALGTVQAMVGPIYDVMQQHNYGQVQRLLIYLTHLASDQYNRERAEDPDHPGVYSRVNQPLPGHSEVSHSLFSKPHN